MVAILDLFSKKSKKLNKLIPIEQAQQLLQQHQNTIDNIYHLSQAPKVHWLEYYLSPINVLANYLQKLPASQNHHHAHDGGFLLHVLEVIELALTKRHTYMLPVGASVETQSAKKDLWNYAVFTCALCHDIGKLISDIAILLFDKKGNKLGRWTPFSGAMNDISTAYYYIYEYNTDRKYQQHKLLPALILHKFFSASALDYLAKDKELFNLLLMTINGRMAEGGTLADIIKYADSTSSAKSLKNIQTETTTTYATPKSLADKLLDTLKYLLVEQKIKINQPGAPIFTTDKYVYLVSKVIMDAVRETLTKDNQQGIPYNNTRLMDELLQFNIIIPTTDNKAIWSIKITGGGFKKEIELTTLKVNISRIYGQEQYPQCFTGTIVEQITQDNQQTEKDNTTSTGPDDTTTTEQTTEQEQSLDDVLPPGVDNTRNTDDTTTTEQTTEQDFSSWLRDGINNKTLEINNAKAKLHTLKEGLFLVSPLIFKLFSEVNWHKAQKKFTNLKITLKNERNENIFKVKVKKSEKKIISGYIVPNAKETIGIKNELPAPNDRLELVTNTVSNKISKNKEQEIIAELKPLGFNAKEVKTALQKIDINGLSVIEIVNIIKKT